LALWVLRDVLPAPATLLARWGDNAVAQGDQEVVTAVVATNARHLVTDPFRLFDGTQCYPAPGALALGEHMLGNSLLALVPYWLTGEPILAMNVVSILALWLAAVCMYALVYYWTGSAVGAFVGGLLFTFRPERLWDVGRPFIHGNQWTPLVLLLLHRTIERNRWRDAAGLTLALCLQFLESVYPVWALVLLVGVYGPALAFRHRRRLLALAPKLLLAAGIAGALFAALMTPYAQMRATWGILGGRGSVLPPYTKFAFGEAYYPGTVVLLLAGVALLDRLWRGRAHPDDPRLPYLLAGLCVLWASILGFVVPGTHIFVPSLTSLAARVLPGLDAVRGLLVARIGLYLTLAFLAGWGVHVLVVRHGAAVRRAVWTLVVAGALLEVFHPALSKATFGYTMGLGVHVTRPSDDLLALYARLEPGATFDVPFARGLAALVQQPHYTLMAAYHHRLVGACYISYLPPTHMYLVALADRLEEPATADALHALGFRTLVVHEEHFGPFLPLFDWKVSGLVRAGRLRPLGRASAHAVFAIETPVSCASDPASLAADTPPAEVVTVQGPQAIVPFTFRNSATVAYRQAAIAPTRTLLRWTTHEGDLVAEDHVSALLPPALGPGASLTLPVEIPVRVGPGDYEVALSLEAPASVVVARHRVRVAPAGTK
jgi:hypothetical protein